MVKNKKQLTVIIVGLIIIVCLSFIVALDIINSKKGGEVIPSNSYVPSYNNEGDNKEGEVTNDWEENEFRQAVPSGVIVPEEGEEIADDLKDIVAVPDEVVSASPGVDANLRVFKIRGEGNKFIPSQIIANFNDTIHVDITAVDKDYDFVLQGYNMRQSIPKGVTKPLEFQAVSEGRFLYYCESCGGVESGAIGEIVVVK
jgi:heme/copper-type cytochrome/quinol oxidase subunit 2